MKSGGIVRNVLFDFLHGVGQTTLLGLFCLTQLPLVEIETNFWKDSQAWFAAPDVSEHRDKAYRALH